MEILDAVIAKDAVIAGIALVVGTFIGGIFTLRNNNKNIFVQTVTNERATWREKLREETAEFCKIGYALSCQDKKDNDVANEQQTLPMDIHRLRELGILIRLRMNPKADANKMNPKADATDSKVIEGTTQIVNQLSHSKNNHQEIERLLLVVEENVQKLLKEAWEISKKEAKTGKLAASKKKYWVSATLAKLWKNLIAERA